MESISKGTSTIDSVPEVGALERPTFLCVSSVHQDNGFGICETKFYIFSVCWDVYAIVKILYRHQDCVR